MSIRHFQVVLAFLPFVSCSIQGRFSRPINTIAFGSCDNQDVRPKIWDAVLTNRPDLWIWGGDNIYGDSYNMDTLSSKYARQKSDPGYRQLHRVARVTGTWDDHDYGINDGGKEYVKRQESRELLFDFLEVPLRDPARRREGAYHARVYGPPGRQVKVLNLDTRYFRDSLRQEPFDDPVYPGVRKHNVPVPGRDILGEAQWEWLERELTASKAEIHIINSSIQVVSAEHPFEKWANFPDALDRLYRLIVRSGAKGVMIISGDRHIGELSSIHFEGRAHPLYDLTSSGLTHTWPKSRPEPNRHRVGNLIIQKNFGLILIDWSSDVPKVRLELRGEGNVLHQSWNLFL